MLTKLFEELLASSDLTPVTASQILPTDEVIVQFANNGTINNHRIQIIDAEDPTNSPDLVNSVYQNPTAYEDTAPSTDGLYTCLTTSPTFSISCADGTSSAYLELDVEDLFDFNVDNTSYVGKTFAEMQSILAQSNVRMEPMVVKTSNEITADYDPFYQTMTVSGTTGQLVSTTDPEGNVIGSSIIGEDGTVTYKIDEGMLLGGTIITTKAATSNEVTHSLVASFYLASDVIGQNIEFMVFRDLYLGWMDGTEGFDEDIAANAVGEMIVEYSSGEQYVTNIADYVGTSFIVDEFGISDFDTSANPAKTGLVSAKVRFRNLNDQIYLRVAQATHIYKFFDDGVSNVGYGLTSRDSRPYVQLKQIPSTLPASVRNLNCMFWSDTAVSDDNLSLDGDYLFASADVEANLANWDVSNVETMVDTFAYAKYHSLPIGNWTPTKLKYLVDTFAYAFTDTAINWQTPELINTKFAFKGSGFSGPLYLDMSNVTNADCMFIDNKTFNHDISDWCVPLLTEAPEGFNMDSILTEDKLPRWGTCPRGGDDNPLPNEIYFTTTTGTIGYFGVAGDQILLSDGTIVDITLTDDVIYFNAPTGKHKVVLKEYRETTNVGLGGEALVELHNFPALNSITNFVFSANNTSPNLVKVPTVLPSNLTNTSWMFQDVLYFNQDISSWDVSNVTDMYQMFFNATSFNQDISSWNVSSVNGMGNMFNNASSFNQDISAWDVSKVVDMHGMFEGATSFNQDLSQWCVTNITQEPENFSDNSPLTTEHKPVWGTCPV